jgi:hypothetical protein
MLERCEQVKGRGKERRSSTQLLRQQSTTDSPLPRLELPKNIDQAFVSTDLVYPSRDKTKKLQGLAFAHECKTDHGV